MIIETTKNLNNFEGILPVLKGGTGGGGIAEAQKTLKIPDLLIFQNKTVTTSAWAEDATYESYGYKANVSCSGVTANHYVDVVFNAVNASSGIFSPICSSGANIVTIWANEIPEGTITIPTIKATEAR